MKHLLAIFSECYNEKGIVYLVTIPKTLQQNVAVEKENRMLFDMGGSTIAQNL